MAKLLNRYKLPSIPIFWTHGKTRIEWRPSQTTFYDWANAVYAFCDGNGIARPTEDQLDEMACRQIPSGYCTGGGQRHVASPTHTTLGRSGGCGSCGGRH